MPDIFITLDEAARFENVLYKTLAQRISRTPQAFKTQAQPREGGGKDQVMVAVSSLSAKARRAHKAAVRLTCGDLLSQKSTDEPPWYVDVDLNWYIENNKEQYYKTIELSHAIQQFIAYTDTERTAYGTRIAKELGISGRTLYRHTENVMEACAWALKFEKEDGKSRDYFKVLSLCRKPKSGGNFPSLSNEQRAVLENIWFDKGFAGNLGTFEMLYEKFEEEAIQRHWAEYPSLKTVSRYVKAVMEQRGATSAHFLAANGPREWKNKQMLKCKRDATTLEVMEFVQGDEHTFDCWVQVVAPNGKIKAVRPKLVAWIDTRTRCILGDVICIDANSQTLKESFIKMVYSTPGGVPKHLHIDNGKDYTAQSMTGQQRQERALQFDSETKGFYRSIGVSEWSRSLPYEPWSKGQVERLFGTVCDGFSRWFDSYTGTLTGSTTYAKRNKNVDTMLERGELLTMEAFFELWTRWKDEKYHQHVHRGLKDAGERFTTPIELYNNAPRYEKAAPPQEYATMLLMKADKAKVTQQGINKFNTLYADYMLSDFIGKWVGVKWDVDDITKLYVFDEQGYKICEAYSAELLQFGDHVQQAALETHIKNQKRQERSAREYLENARMPYEQRDNESRPSDAIGKLDLTIKAERKSNAIAMPNDREYRAEMAAKRKTGTPNNEFFENKAADALSLARHTARISTKRWRRSLTRIMPCAPNWTRQMNPKPQ